MSDSGTRTDAGGRPIIGVVIVFGLMAFILYPAIVLQHMVDVAAATGAGLGSAALIIVLLPDQSQHNIGHALLFGIMLLIPFFVVLALIGRDGGQVYLAGFLLVYAMRRTLRLTRGRTGGWWSRLGADLS